MAAVVIIVVLMAVGATGGGEIATSSTRVTAKMMLYVRMSGRTIISSVS